MKNRNAAFLGGSKRWDFHRLIRRSWGFAPVRSETDQVTNSLTLRLSAHSTEKLRLEQSLADSRTRAVIAIIPTSCDTIGCLLRPERALKTKPRKVCRKSS
jgi:hypothetical protein